MHKLLDTTKTVGEVEVGGTEYEVCAEAVAEHHASTDLTVELRCFLRATDPNHIGESAHPDWLPASQTLRERIELDEARDLTKDIFSSWCHKVEGSIPARA